MSNMALSIDFLISKERIVIFSDKFHKSFQKFSVFTYLGSVGCYSIEHKIFF